MKWNKRIPTGNSALDRLLGVGIPKTKPSQFTTTLPKFIEMSPSPQVPAFNPFSVGAIEARFSGAVQQVLDRWPHLTVRVEMLSSLVLREMKEAERYLPATHSLEYEVTESLDRSVGVHWQLTDISGYRSLSGSTHKSPWQTTIFDLPEPPPPEPKAPEPDEEPEDCYEDWPLH